MNESADTNGAFERWMSECERGLSRWSALQGVASDVLSGDLDEFEGSELVYHLDLRINDVRSDEYEEAVTLFSVAKDKHDRE